MIIFINTRNIKILVTSFILLCSSIIFFSYNDIEQVSITQNTALEPIYRGDEELPKVSFACNVAWGDEYIPEILNILQDKDVNITFFIVGEWAEKNEDLLKLIYNNGHEIGNHGYKHIDPVKLTVKENKLEIKKTEDLLFDIIGLKTNLFAPPYGSFNEYTLFAVEDLNYNLIMWSIDTVDWKSPGKDYIINKVTKKIHNGAIILMHPTEDIINSIENIINEIEKEGYQITTVSNIL